MRILLTANASYVPPRGGATRSNLLWLEYMAARGHECRIVAAALAEGAAKRVQMAQEGLDRQTLVERGVELYEVAERARQAAVLRRQIREFQPDWVLVSSEDLGHALLCCAARSENCRRLGCCFRRKFAPPRSSAKHMRRRPDAWFIWRTRRS